MQMVVQRELRAAARRPGTFWMRVLAGGFAALALLQNTGHVRNGRSLFFTAVTLAFVACVFEGVRRSASSVAAERAEGTLELLFLTPLTGTELLRGKFAAIVISTFPAALAVVPILAASLLLGGISAGEFVRAIFALAHVLIFVIALGICSSARAKDGNSAMTGTLLILGFSAGVLIFLGLGIPWLRAVNPMTPAISISASEYGRAPWSFWISIALWQSFGWVLLNTSGRRLIAFSHAQQEKTFHAVAPVHTADLRYKPGDLPPTRINDAPRWFKENPIDWFTVRHMGMHEGRWGILFISIFLGIFGILAPSLGGVFSVFAFGILALSLCITSARSMARLNESGALELLITTPLSDRGILEGHRRGLHRVFLGPFIVWIVVLLSFSFGARTLPLYISGYLAVGAFLMVWMTPWFGVAAALKSKSPHRAVGWTIFFVLLVPRLIFCWLGDAIYFAIAGLCARSYVKNHFRSMVAERFGS
jgi:hypothetical protein